MLLGPEVGWDGLAGGGLVFDDGEGVVAEPFEELEPTVGVVEGEGVGEGGLDGASVGKAQEPVLAVGEDAHADAPALVGLLQVVVELVDVVGVGIEAAVGADSALELDEGVEASEVDGRREPRAGGFSSCISSVPTKPVIVRKWLTAVVMFLSASLFSWRRRTSAAAFLMLESL